MTRSGRAVAACRRAVPPPWRTSRLGRLLAPLWTHEFTQAAVSGCLALTGAGVLRAGPPCSQARCLAPTHANNGCEHAPRSPTLNAQPPGLPRNAADCRSAAAGNDRNALLPIEPLPKTYNSRTIRIKNPVDENVMLPMGRGGRCIMCIRTGGESGWACITVSCRAAWQCKLTYHAPDSRSLQAAQRSAGSRCGSNQVLFRPLAALQPQCHTRGRAGCQLLQEPSGLTGLSSKSSRAGCSGSLCVLRQLGLREACWTLSISLVIGSSSRGGRAGGPCALPLGEVESARLVCCRQVHGRQVGLDAWDLALLPCVKLVEGHGVLQAGWVYGAGREARRSGKGCCR